MATTRGRPSLTDIIIMFSLMRQPRAYSDIPKKWIFPVAADAPQEWKAFLSQPVRISRPAFYRATQKLLAHGLIQVDEGYPTRWRLEDQTKAIHYIEHRLSQVLPQPRKQPGRPRTHHKQRTLSKAFSVLRKPGRLKDFPPVKTRTGQPWNDMITGFIGLEEAGRIVKAKRIDDFSKRETRKKEINRKMALYSRGTRPEV